MKFDELDQRMRVFETAHDYCVLPGMFIVARLDGKSFTSLTKEKHHFDAPFDVRFRDMMVETTRHVMDVGFRTLYGYTESDEISILLHRADTTFARKLRKINSVLAGEASAKFSLLLGDIGAFDCRVSELPSPELVVDYFRWRNEDAHRNALNAHGYWALRREGLDVQEATARLHGLSVAAKNELLFQLGINFNDLPAWQRRGVGVYWESFVREGTDPRTDKLATAERRRLRTELELPMKDAYSAFLARLLAEQSEKDE